MPKSGERKGRPQGCSLCSHRLRRLKPLTPTLSPATHSAHAVYAALSHFGFESAPYIWMWPANPGFKPLNFDFDKDTTDLNPSTPLVTYSTSLDISQFKNRGGKIIWYHGVSDPGPPSLGTIEYYEELAARNGGIEETKNIARLFLVPNMGHCRGGPATDQFDMLTPLVAWVEQGKAPDRVIASVKNFTVAPTARSRPLCPYPQQVRFTGPAGGDLSIASNYACVTPK